MPLFQLAVLVLWRQRDTLVRKPPPSLSITSKPNSFLHIQYNLLPAAFYKSCAFSIVNWGGVARFQTYDGTSAGMAPIVQVDNVTATVAQVEHNVNMNLDGMLDLLHHHVHVAITENKDMVPSSARSRRPSNVEVAAAKDADSTTTDVTLATPIVERASETGPEETGDAGAPDPPAKDRFRKRVSAPETLPPPAAAEEETPGLAKPVQAMFSPCSEAVMARHFSPLISAAQQQVTPLTEQAIVKSAKEDKQSKRGNKSTPKKSGMQRKGKSDVKKTNSDKKVDYGHRKKAEKNDISFSFNMDFFFSGSTDQLVSSTPLLVDTVCIAQVCVVLRAPAFLLAPQRVSLNPLSVHLRRLEGMPVLPTGFRMAREPPQPAAQAQQQAQKQVREPRQTLTQETQEEDDTPEQQSDQESTVEGGEDEARRDDAVPPSFFISMRMPDGRVYDTKDLSYGARIALEDLTVVFCGLVERELLWERIQAEPLRIEFFWRHTTPLVSNRRFNQMEIDRYIHDPNLVNIIKQSGNPFALPNPLPTKFAEISVDLSSLTRTSRLLSLEVPLTVHSAQASSAHGGDIERGTCPPPFRPLQLLESGARLRLTICLAVPLNCLPRPAPARCTYGRLLAVMTARGLQRSGVLQLVQQLNEPANRPSTPHGTASGERRSSRPPSDISTPGVSGFCLRDRHLHLLFTEGRADEDLHQVWSTLRGLSRHDCRLLFHSGMLFSERLYQRQPLFRTLEGLPLRSVLQQTRLYTADKQQQQPTAMRGVSECFRSQWMSEVLRQSLLPAEASLIGLQQLLSV